MKYLVRVKRNRKTKLRTAHIWNAKHQDTLCRMHSTKGFNIVGYVYEDEIASDKHHVCMMCNNVSNR